jgi:hypothetical protein
MSKTLSEPAIVDEKGFRILGVKFYLFFSLYFYLHLKTNKNNHTKKQTQIDTQRTWLDTNDLVLSLTIVQDLRHKEHGR